MSIRIAGNRPLRTLPGLDTRPTSARVREAMFNIWQGKIAGCRWLDLCAGSGAMGAEALCRGAAVVVGIEQSSRACQVIRENWSRLATPEQQFQVLRGDVLQWLPRLGGQQFQRIYFDPPYASGLYLPVLAAITKQQLLAGELAVEYDPAVAPAELSQGEVGQELLGFWVTRRKRYGSSSLVFLQAISAASGPAH